MPINELQAFSSHGLGTMRRMNGDGTATIVCRICGKPLYRGLYQGFSTATCSDCAGTSTEGVVTGAITLPDGRVVYQAEYSGDAILYSETPQMEKVGLAKAIFRALGFGRPPAPKPESKVSKKVSREKTRKPIFEPGDDE